MLKKFHVPLKGLNFCCVTKHGVHEDLSDSANVALIIMEETKLYFPEKIIDLKEEM